MENEKVIINKLNNIESSLAYIREYLEDITLTQDDLKSIEEAQDDLKKGKTISLKDLKRELDI